MWRRNLKESCLRICRTKSIAAISDQEESSPQEGLNWVQGSKDGIQNLVCNNLGISEGGRIAMWRLGSSTGVEFLRHIKIKRLTVFHLRT